ncbi:hypothetical protein N9O65_02445 [Schleiferiaceae bacterium]|nr:hypothetical protein [Schleiferiaceae bacterium]
MDEPFRFAQNKPDTSYFAKALIQQSEAQSQLGIKWAEWLQLSAGF